MRKKVLIAVLCITPAKTNADIGTISSAKGKKLGDMTYKVHPDGYNQMDLHHW